MYAYHSTNDDFDNDDLNFSWLYRNYWLELVLLSKWDIVNEKLLFYLDRNHESVIDGLNTFLGLKGEFLLANEVPPNLFVGNPKILQPGKCIALIGINPAYRPDDSSFLDSEINLAKSCLEKWRSSKDSKDLQPWFTKMENFFLGDSYYGRYFTRLGNIIGQGIFSETWASYKGQKAARMIFHKHVLKFDILPYYSKKAGFNNQLLHEIYSSEPALIAYQEYISSMIDFANPRFVILNGMSVTSVVEELFAIEDFATINLGPTPRTEIQVGEISINGSVVNALGVKFVNSIHGPTSDQDWEYIWQAWNTLGII